MTDFWQNIFSTFIAMLGCFVVLGIVFCLVFKDKKKSRNEKTEPVVKCEEKKHVRTMDVILVIVGVTLLVFTVTMIIVFLHVGSVPDTLITCVFAALGGECGVMGWIKTSKDKRYDRKVEKERREEEKNDYK